MAEPEQMDAARQAAAYHGLATNRAYPVDERLRCALQALLIYEAEWDRLHGEGEHVHLSSACRHAVESGREHLHRRCQTDTLRYDGTHKVAAQCKDCGAPCICPCHKEATDAGRERLGCGS